MIVALGLAGCAATWTDGEGRLRAVGACALTETDLEHGRRTTLQAFGMVLRLDHGDPGLTLGSYRRNAWHPRTVRAFDAREILATLDGDRPPPEGEPATRRAWFVTAERATPLDPPLFGSTILGLDLFLGETPRLAAVYHAHERVRATAIGPDGVLIVLRPDPTAAPSSILAWSIPIHLPESDQAARAVPFENP